MTSAERSRQPLMVQRMMPPAAGAVGIRRCSAQDIDTATGIFCEHARAAPSALPLLVVQWQHTLGEGRCELPAHKVRCALPVQVGALRNGGGCLSHTLHALLAGAHQDMPAAPPSAAGQSCLGAQAFTGPWFAGQAQQPDSADSTRPAA